MAGVLLLIALFLVACVGLTVLAMVSGVLYVNRDTEWAREAAIVLIVVGAGFLMWLL